MFGYRRSTDGEKTGVLAARQAVCEPQHSRAPEPTAKTVVEKSGPLDVATVGEDETVLDALRIMADRDAAAVAVTSPAGLVGILSERDYARAGLRESRAAKHTPVVDVMARIVARVAPEDGVRRCLDLMNELEVTHAAVLDEGRLVGLLSRTDLLLALIAYHERVFHEAEMDQKLLFLRGTYSC